MKYIDITLSMNLKEQKVALGGFEPPLRGPEPRMIDHYTTGLVNEVIMNEVIPKGFHHR